MNKRTFPNFFERCAYKVLKLGLQVGGILGYRVRCHNTHFVPESGPGLICSNHQSHLDPMLVGIAVRRPVSYLAKKSLFEGKILKHLQHSTNCIPIDRKKGVAGIKKTIKRLKNNELVLVFPEGTRSKNGEIQKFKGGFLALARRTQAPIIPVAVEGAHEAYPPGQAFPGPGHVHVVFGEPITPDDYETMDEEEVTQVLEQRVRACFEIARMKRDHHKSLNIRNRQPEWRLSNPAEQQ